MGYIGILNVNKQNILNCFKNKLLFSSTHVYVDFNRAKISNQDLAKFQIGKK